MEITQTPVTPAPAATQSAGSQVNSDFEMFLQMLTAQMQYQDPLNPIDSTDYATQLATFSSVEQAVLTNDLLKSLTAQMTSGNLIDMAGLVGKDVQTTGAAYFDGTPVALDITTAPLSESAALVITDDTGLEVGRMPVSPSQSTQTITWDGTNDSGSPLPNGLYRFEVVSMSGEAVIAKTPVSTYDTVTEVRMENEQTVLVLKGGVTVPADQVIALRDGST